jgi:hypothetical protein
MYPIRELNQLAGRKAALRRHIGRHRAACVRGGSRLVQPLAWLDRMMAHWRRLSPLARLAVVPLGLLLAKSAAPRPRLLGLLLRWGPIAWNLVRGFGQARRG